jgi:hypothetical protein
VVVRIGDVDVALGVHREMACLLEATRIARRLIDEMPQRQGRPVSRSPVAVLTADTRPARDGRDDSGLRLRGNL